MANQTLFPLLQPIPDPDPPTPPTDQKILQALQLYEQGTHISIIRSTLSLERSMVLWIGDVTRQIVAFMDSTMSTTFDLQPTQAELLLAINEQNFGFSNAINQQVGAYRRDHATTEAWRTANDIPDTWDAYRAVTRTDV